MTNPLDTTTPRIQLSVGAMVGTQVTITRTDSAGNQAPVRSANPAMLSGGAWVGFDYEPPFQVPVTYTAVSDTGDTKISPPQVLNVATPWLIHPGIPDLSRPVTIADLGDETTGTDQGVHYVLGRRNPIVITGGQRRGGTFDLVLRSYSTHEAQALTTLLDDASVLLLQVAYPFTGLTDYRWVAVGDVVKHRVSRDWSDPGLRWTLPCTVTDPPVGLLRPQWTYGDVIANYGSYTAVAAAFASYRDLITDTVRTA